MENLSRFEGDFYPDMKGRQRSLLFFDLFEKFSIADKAFDISPGLEKETFTSAPDMPVGYHPGMEEDLNRFFPFFSIQKDGLNMDWLHPRIDDYDLITRNGCSNQRAIVIINCLVIPQAFKNLNLAELFSVPDIYAQVVNRDQESNNGNSACDDISPVREGQKSNNACNDFSQVHFFDCITPLSPSQEGVVNDVTSQEGLVRSCHAI